jgi:hypothetical protein
MRSGFILAEHVLPKNRGNNYVGAAGLPGPMDSELMWGGIGR